MKYLTVTYAVDERVDSADAIAEITAKHAQSVCATAWWNMCPFTTDIEANANMDELLRKYEIEMDMIQYSLTLSQLIDSHRVLRTERMASRAEMLAENQKIYEHTVVCARASVLDGEYIDVKKLKKMTLIELANKISDPYYG